MAAARRLQAISRALSAAPASADEVLRVAFAGVHRSVPTDNGSWPTNSHNWASAFAGSPDTAFEVVGFFDNGAATRAEFVEVWREAWGEVPAFDDFDEMLREATPDILVVGTRQTFHSANIVSAIEAGVRGIVCDKPLVTSLAEADAIFAAFEAAEAAGKPVAFAFGTELRWDTAYQTLARVLASGVIGTVTSVTASGVGDCINHGCHW